MNLKAGRTFGPPPLEINLGVFSQTREKLADYSEYSIDYGDGSRGPLQQYCVATNSNSCDIRASHTYAFSGVFTATLYGIKAGEALVLGTVRITVGNPLKITKKLGEIENGFLIQKISQDNVEGIANYSKDGTVAVPYFPQQRTLHIGDDIGRSCKGISDKLTSIDFSGQQLTFTHPKPPPLAAGIRNGSTSLFI